MNNKGIVLLIAMIVMMLLLVLTGVYFSGLITEKKSADTEKSALQALNFAEAGGNQALSELRERIQGGLDLNGQPLGLNGRIKNDTPHFNFNNYQNNPLALLVDYAYAYNDTARFVISDNKAILTVTPLDLGTTSVQGLYTATIQITSAKPPEDQTQGLNQRFVFYYNYLLESRGRVVFPNASKTIGLLGTFEVRIFRPTFAKFALFTSHHRMPSGTTVWFTANTNFNGPVHTNERFSFANNPSGHFTSEVTQHETKARFYNNGSPLLLNADYNGTRDVPIFDQGFQRGYDLVNLPSTVSQTDLKRQALGGTSEPGSNGIFVPNDGTNLIGGIYIRGNQGNHADDAVINMGTDTNGPVYTITRDTTTTIVTVDYTNNQTKVQTGSDIQTYQGLPDGIDNEGILIYANDDVKSFAGTVQKDSSITVSGERDIVITNNVLYEQYNPSPLNADGYNNVLGILSWGGNVRIGTGAPNNINMHGVVMAPHGIFTVDNYNIGSPRGTATLLGGAITDFYGPFGTFSGTSQISGYGRNFIYDTRMLLGKTPPYFPYLPNLDSSDGQTLKQKPVWEDKGA